jgi:hypothetical protein
MDCRGRWAVECRWLDEGGFGGAWIVDPPLAGAAGTSVHVMGFFFWSGDLGVGGVGALMLCIEASHPDNTWVWNPLSLCTVQRHVS